MLQGSVVSRTGVRYYQHNDVADAARRLLSAFHGLVFRDVPNDVTEKSPLKVDLRPSLPRRRVKLFLSSLEDAAQTLKLDMTSRRYRLAFTKNYRSLMPADRRAYRLDVLEAAQDGHGALWVNGEKYTLGPEVIQDKERFRMEWSALLEGLRNVQAELDVEPNQRHKCAACTSVKLLESPSTIHDNTICQFCVTDWLDKLGLLLVRFDTAWCYFERNYINELIDIERKSKKLIMDCIHADEELRQYEKLYHRLLLPKEPLPTNGHAGKDKAGQYATQPTSSSSYLQERVRETYTEFIRSIAALNVAANARRKGRGDYTFDLFEHAMTIQRRVASDDAFCLPHSVSPWLRSMSLDDLRSLQVIASPLLENLRALRDYLNHIGELPERIDPHLCQNYDLVAHLAQLEASWDAAKTHLENEDTAKRLTSFLRFVSHIVDVDLTLTGKSSGRQVSSDGTASVDSTSLSSTEDTDFMESRRHHRETLEEMIATCDVAAFLAIPKLAVLYYISNPSPESSNARLFEFLLPSSFPVEPRTTGSSRLLFHVNDPLKKIARTTQSQALPSHQAPTKALVTGTSSSTSLFQSTQEFPCGSEFFEMLRHLGDLDYASMIPECFHRVVHEGIGIADLLHTLRRSSNDYSTLPFDLEEVVWRHLLDRCISNSASSGNLATSLPAPTQITLCVDGFYLALEEASMTLQRTHPVEWNAFLQTIMKCLESLRCPAVSSSPPSSPNHSTAKPSVPTTTAAAPPPASPTHETLDRIFSDVDVYSPQSGRLFQSSPITPCHP